MVELNIDYLQQKIRSSSTDECEVGTVTSVTRNLDPAQRRVIVQYQFRQIDAEGSAYKTLSKTFASERRYINWVNKQANDPTIHLNLLSCEIS